MLKLSPFLLLSLLSLWLSNFPLGHHVPREGHGGGITAAGLHSP